MKLLSHAATLIVGAILAFGGIQAWQWYHPSKTGTLARRIEPPYDAAESRLSRLLDKVVVPAPPEIVAFKPTQEGAAKIAKKIGGELPKDGIIVGFHDIKALPNGATAIETLVPSEEHAGASEVRLRIYPKNAPFFAWCLERSLGVYAGNGYGRASGKVLNIEFTQSLFRTGPAIWETKAGTMLTPQGEFAYVMVGARVTF